MKSQFCAMLNTDLYQFSLVVADILLPSPKLGRGAGCEGINHLCHDFWKLVLPKLNYTPYKAKSMTKPISILGINSAYHESSACLIQDGKLIAAAEEERFNRIKHAKTSGVDNFSGAE